MLTTSGMRSTVSWPAVGTWNELELPALFFLDRLGTLLIITIPPIYIGHHRLSYFNRVYSQSNVYYPLLRDCNWLRFYKSLTFDLWVKCTAVN